MAAHCVKCLFRPQLSLLRQFFLPRNVLTCTVRLSSQDAGSTGAGNSESPEQEQTTSSAPQPPEEDYGETETEYETKQRILKASLPFVEEYGWTKNAIAAGADVQGLPGVSHGLFPRGGVELVFFFYTDCNRLLAGHLEEKVRDIKSQENGKISVGNFIKEAVEMRLRMIIPYMDRWPQAMAIQALPQNAPEALANLSNLMDEIWYHAGDDSTDFNWYTKRLSLAAVYKATEVYMLQDSSEDNQNTWAFLSRRLNDLQSFGKLNKNAQEFSAVAGEGLIGLCIMTRNILGMNSRAR